MYTPTNAHINTFFFRALSFFFFCSFLLFVLPLSHRRCWIMEAEGGQWWKWDSQTAHSPSPSPCTGLITPSPSPPLPRRLLALLLPLPQAAVLCRPVPTAKPPRNLISCPGSFLALPVCLPAALHALHMCVCFCVCALSTCPFAIVFLSLSSYFCLFVCPSGSLQSSQSS